MLPNVATVQLEDEQVSIGGLTMGQGTPYIITEFNPWDAAEVTATDVGLGARPGMVSGINVYKSRPVSFRVLIPVSEDGKPGTARRSSLLRTAMSPQSADVPLHFRIGGVTYFVMGRPRMVKGDTKRWGAGHLSFECRFLATDPRIYRAELQSQNLLLSVPTTSGLWMPMDFTTGPASPDAVQGSGSFFGDFTYDDAFTRADSITSIGGSWTARNGTWGITANKAYQVAAGGTDHGIVTVSTGKTSHHVSALVGTAAQGQGVVVRYLDADNYVRMSSSTTFATWILTKTVAGVTTTLVNTGLSTLSNVTPALTAAGNTFTMTVNGAQSTSFTITDPELQTGTHAGLFMPAATTGTGFTFDNASVKSLATGLDLRHGSDLALPPITCFNDGDVPANWQVAITAVPEGIGAGGISLYSAETGRALSLPNIILVPGSTLYLDSSEHSVLTTSGSSYLVARQYLSADSTWWDLQVGVNSISVNIGSGTASAVIYWYPAEV